MNKVISIKELKSSEDINFIKTLKKYKLCYIDDISDTIYDYTPDAKAYRETDEWKTENQRCEDALKERGSISMYDSEFSYLTNPIMKRGSECDNFPNPDYIPGEQEMYAYFTPLSLDEQWGDDWNDSPYDCNAGTPYDIVIDETKITDDGIRIAMKSHDISIIQVPFAIKSYNARLPKDWGAQTYFSVDDINHGAIAWIYDYNYQNKKGVAIHAGINPFDFIQKLEEIETNNPDWEYTPEDE